MQTQQSQTLVLTRFLKAKPEKVFKAWSDPALVAKWFRPNPRWLSCDADIEPVPGGKYIVSLTHSDGNQVTTGGKVVEMIPNETISFTWIDSCSGTRDESLVTITLEPSGEGTQLTLTHSRLATEDAKNRVNGGWTGCLDSLTEFVQA